MKYRVAGDGWDETFVVDSCPLGREWRITDPSGTEHTVRVEELEEGVLRLVHGNETHTLTILPGNRGGETIRFLLNDRHVQLEVEDEIDRLTAVLGDAGAGGGRREMRSIMPGIIRGLLVAEGDTVEVDTPILLLEAMKMENEIRSPLAGTVSRIVVQPGQTIAAGELLAVIEGS